jgi:hypothetical protein
VARNWTNGSGIALSASNLNALEADVTTALGVPDAALATRVQAGATRTALDARYAKTTDLSAKENAIPTGGIDTFLRGDKTWVQINTGASQTGADPQPREALFDPTNVSAPAGTQLNIPTHISNPGQVAHPSVVLVPEGWNGYKYWMAITPYPAGNDDHEDPNILASHDGINWVVPDGVTNPLVDADGQPEYHSDNELKMGPNNTMYMFYRYSDNTATGHEEQLRFMTSTDGTTWTAPQTFRDKDWTLERLMSPSLVYEDGAWTMYAVNILPSPNVVVRLRSDTADPMSAWSAPVTVPCGTMLAGKEPWHIYVTKVGGRYYGLLNDCTLDANGASGELLFISSGDGQTFTNSGAGVVPKVVAGKHDNLYRSCMIPSSEGAEFGFRVFYTGWLNTGPTWNLFYTFLGEGRWKTLTLQGAWVPYVGGGGYSQEGLRYKRKGKTVTVEGTLKSGALSSVIATLPADSSPLYSAMYPVNAAGTLGMIRIDGTAGATGNITYFAGTTAPSYMPIHVKFEMG